MITPIDKSGPGRRGAAPLDGCDIEVGGERFRYLRVQCGEPAPPGHLTRCEWDVARRAAAGGTSKQIAAARGVSERTVHRQLDSVYRKLGIGSRSELSERIFGERV